MPSGPLDQVLSRHLVRALGAPLGISARGEGRNGLALQADASPNLPFVGGRLGALGDHQPVNVADERGLGMAQHGVVTLHSAPGPLGVFLGYKLFRISAPAHWQGGLVRLVAPGLLKPDLVGAAPLRQPQDGGQVRAADAGQAIRVEGAVGHHLFPHST